MNATDIIRELLAVRELEREYLRHKQRRIVMFPQKNDESRAAWAKVQAMKAELDQRKPAAWAVAEMHVRAIDAWLRVKRSPSDAVMVAYLGHKRETEVPVQPLDLGAGAGKIMCLECEGTGDWTRFHPEPDTGPHACVACKGTGHVLVSI